jgi:3-isopropylmalate/(R)-2-methylmalate dehydratase large subunit
LGGSSITDKIWEKHLLKRGDDGRDLIYIDRHLVHEVTSPLAFDELRTRSMKVRRPELTLGLMDHNVPTGDRAETVKDEMSAKQMEALAKNAADFGVPLFDYLSPFQGISHVVAPELGFTLPGTTLVCGDSHTSTHGAVGALAFGVGTSEVAHVLATQALWMAKPLQMELRLLGRLSPGVTAKDVSLAEVGLFGTGGAIGHAVEFSGEAVREMSIEERMTICNMAVEGGARTAIISPDEKTFEYLGKAPLAPQGEEWSEALQEWKGLSTDGGFRFDKTLTMDVSSVEPQVTWGTNPSMVVPVTGSVPVPDELDDEREREAVQRAIRYMGLAPGSRITDIEIDRAFIGSCTNGRLSDLLAAAAVVRGRRVHPHVKAMVVPGSQLVKRTAERLELHRIFTDAGFEWRNSGCSLCLGMNEDRLATGERAASTSNRNFENRQGPGGRTHLASPASVAAAAVEGHFADVRELDASPLPGVEEM